MTGTIPKIVGIAGRSGSGKSTIAKMIESNYSDRVVRIAQDKFFKIKADNDNWEAPTALDNHNLIHSLKKLKRNESTHIPSMPWTEVYDRQVDPQSIVLVEGYLLFEDPQLADLCDIKIYIDVSDENILHRRAKRDRAQKEMDCADYVMNIVIPHSYIYMDVQKRVADIIIDGNKSTEHVYCNTLQYLRRKSLL